MLTHDRTHMPRNAGVTLVELLVTIAVLGILLATAAPSYTTMLEKRRLIAATEGVYAHLQFARSEAVKFGGSDVNLNVSIKAATPWCLGISNDTSNCDCNTNGACVYGPTGTTFERYLRSTEFSNVSISTTKSNAQIDRVRGSFANGGGSVTLASPSGLTTKVIFSKMGRVRICSDSNLGGYPSCP
jgi:type IV fimbrial biogenesis protein FimT